MAVSAVPGAPSLPPIEGSPPKVMISPDDMKGAPRGGCDCLPRPPKAVAAEPAAPESAALASAASEPASPEPAAIPTTTYVLRYEDRWFGVEKRVAFEAETVAEALELMEREPVGRWAELTCDGRLVCRRGGEPGGGRDYWVVD